MPSPKGPTAAQTLGFTTLQGQSFTTQGQDLYVIDQQKWFMMIYVTILASVQWFIFGHSTSYECYIFCDNRTLPEASLTRTRTHLVPTFWPSYHLQRTRCSVCSLFTFFAQSSLPIVTFHVSVLPKCFCM